VAIKIRKAVNISSILAHGVEDTALLASRFRATKAVRSAATHGWIKYFVLSHYNTPNKVEILLNKKGHTPAH